jgi:hypothetical protein
LFVAVGTRSRYVMLYAAYTVWYPFKYLGMYLNDVLIARNLSLVTQSWRILSICRYIHVYHSSPLSQYIYIYILLSYTFRRAHVGKMSSPGLSDGIFSNPKFQIAQISEGLVMDYVGIHILWPFGFFTTFWYILWLAGTSYGHLVYMFSPVLVFCTMKIWQPWSSQIYYEHADARVSRWAVKRMFSFSCVNSINGWLKAITFSHLFPSYMYIHYVSYNMYRKKVKPYKVIVPKKRDKWTPVCLALKCKQIKGCQIFDLGLVQKRSHSESVLHM